MLAIDTVLQQRYRIIRQLGQGGMGAVYEAVDERLDKTVAVKEILLDLETSTDEEQKNLIIMAFKREAQSLVKARHSTVPDVTDYFMDLERRFLVMEYIEGDDLARMLGKRKEPFPLETVLPWINQLLEALEYLHKLTPPIIHRDIKPQNLKLNDWGRIKLLDFGIAKNSDQNSTLTQNTFLGATLNFSPIEQVLRVIAPTFREFILLNHRDKVEKIMQQDTDARCDIFALGGTFYHLLTNKVPPDVTTRALKVWGENPDPLENPSELNSEIPPKVSEWLMKAMAFEREDRFASAKEMQDDLQRTLLDIQREKERIQQQIEQEYLQKKAEVKNPDKIKTQAVTELLIKPAGMQEMEIENSPPAIISPAPTDASQIRKSDTFSSVEEKSDTNLTVSDTRIPITNTADELTAVLYISEDIQNKQNEEILRRQTDSKPETAHPVFAAASPNITATKPINPNRKYILALPIIGIFTFVVFGIGLFGLITLMNYSTSTGSSTTNQSTLENENTVTEATPEDTPTLETDTTLTEETPDTTTSSTPETSASATPQKTQTTVVKSTPKPPPVTRQTPKPVVASKPPEPKPAAKTQPKSTPKKKVTFDDLIKP